MATRKKAAYTERHKETSATSRSHGKSQVAARIQAEQSHGGTKQAERKQTTSKRIEQKVRDIMGRRVVAVTSVTFLPEAAQIMLQEDVGALPVVQEDGTLMGIITDRDITVRGVAVGKDVNNTQVADVFTAEDLVTITPETSLDEAEQIMAEHQVRRLPIVESNNHLIGIVSLADITRATGEQAAEVMGEIVKPGGEHSQLTEEQGGEATS